MGLDESPVAAWLWTGSLFVIESRNGLWRSAGLCEIRLHLSPSLGSWRPSDGSPVRTRLETPGVRRRAGARHEPPEDGQPGPPPFEQPRPKVPQTEIPV